MPEAICGYADPNDSLAEQCTRDIYPGHNGGKRCVLHDENVDKNLRTFSSTLGRALSEQEEEQAVHVVNLPGVVFPHGFSLENALDSRTFRKPLKLSSCEFNEDVSYEGMRFSRPIIFAFAKFKKAALFKGAQFEGEVSFSHVEFTEASSFENAHFSQLANFQDATFWADVSFEKTEFANGSMLRDARFKGKSTNFTDAIFHQSTDFTRAQFNGFAHFTGAQFREDAVFDGAQFHGPVAFIGAKFARDAYFRKVRHRDARSSEDEYQPVRFSGTGKTDFGGTNFRRGVEFNGAVFPQDQEKGEIRFTDVSIDNPEHVLFQNINLSRTSFLGTNLRKIHFINAKWARPSLWQLPWPFPSRVSMVFDDPRTGHTKNASLREDLYHQVAELYRQVRTNMEESKQEIEAGHFYVGQMDMRQHDSVLPWSYRRVYLPLYRFAALYGESPPRPMAIYAFLSVLFALLYLAGGFQIGETVFHRPVPDLSAILHEGFWRAFGEALFQAATAGPLLRPEIRVLSPLLRLVQYLNIMANVFFLALTVIALRRLYKR